MTQPDFIQIPMPALDDPKLQPADKMLLGYVYWMTKLALMKCIASNSTLAELCGMSERYIQISLTRLEEQGYIRRVYQGDNSRHRVEIICQIAYSAQPSLERTTVRRGTNHSSQGLRTTVHHTISNNKQIIEKDSTNVLDVPSKVYGKPEINELFDYWQSKTGLAIQSRVKENRNACNSMLKKHGVDKLRLIIGGVAQAQGEKFAPQISNFIDLQSKLDALLVWGRKQQAIRGTIKI